MASEEEDDQRTTPGKDNPENEMWTAGHQYK